MIFLYVDGVNAMLIIIILLVILAIVVAIKLAILPIAVAIYCLRKNRHQQQDITSNKEEPPTVENDNTSDSQSVHLATG